MAGRSTNQTSYTIRRFDKHGAIVHNGLVSKKSQMNKTSKLKGNKKMSTVETIVNAAARVIEKTVKFFDLKTFDEKKEKIKVEFTPATTYAEAVERLGNDEKSLVDAINNILETRAVAAKRKEFLGSNGVPKKVVLDFINPWRMTAEFAKMVTLEKGQDGWKKQYNDQTGAIVKKVAQNEFMKEAILSAAQNTADTGEAEDEGEES